MTGGDGDSQIQTGLLSEDELARLRALRGDPGGSLATLLLYGRDGVQVVPLAEGRPVVVGRSAPADVAIRDASLSRQHALLELRSGHVWVEDLGSTNGTWIDGERVDRAVIQTGSVLALGAVTASVHSAGAGERFDLDGHERFIHEQGAEVARARAHGHPVALLLVRSAGRRQVPVARWLQRVRAALRPYDRVALYSTDTVEVMLPEAGRGHARAVAERILGGKDRLLCGLAVLPDDAGTSGELLERARVALQAATAERPLREAAPPQTGAPPGAAVADGPVIRSAAMEKVFVTARKLAASTIPVLLLGETGTGKEVVARAIHEGGPRAGQPLICVNCGSIPSQLVESTLFGHEKGAFTGADARRKGVFENADGGTVLLDEVGELPAPAQAALLRVLETKRFTRVGAGEETQVDVRVLAATHRDLDAMCREGSFREDLLFRLNAMTLTLPALRRRPEEIEPLVRHFLAAAAAADDRPLPAIAPDALSLLVRYPWPGNVRELRNAVERAVVLAVGDEIGFEDLPEPLRRLGEGEGADVRGGFDEPVLGAATTELSVAGADNLDLRAEVGRYEADLILRALLECAWDRNAAAKWLGIPVRTLSHKMTAHGIQRGVPTGQQG